MHRKIILVICGVLYLLSAQAQKKAVINNTTSPNMQLKSIDIDDCRWTSGFWAEKQQKCTDVMIPNLGRLMEDPETIHAYENFKIAAGLKEGEFKGWSFHDGDFYKYVEALAYAYSLTNDEKINERMDEIIAIISKAQQDDGYISTYIQIGHGVKGFHHESEHRFKLTNGPYSHGPQHEFYNLGHLMTSACVHHRITGKKNFLDIAIKASDNIYNHFKDPSPELARIDWNPPHYMGLVEMYRTTGDKKYLELAETFINMLGTAPKKSDDHRGMDHSQRGTPIREESQAVGHAGHGNYLYSGVVDLYAETGEEALLDAMERIWQNVATRKMYLTGATGPHHFGISKHAIVAEAYGLDFELPNQKAYNETCANIGNAMWNWRMFLLNGDAKFAEIAELVFYNSALSGIDLEGRNFFYTNPLRYIQDHPQNNKDKGERGPFMSVFCCPPNIIRTIAKMHTYAYNTSDKGIWVNLYGSNELDTKLADGFNVKLNQQTDYPWDGLVRISVDIKKKKEFSMMLRIPAWAEASEIKVNGVAVDAQVVPGSYFELKRNWSKGDVVELNMPMTPQLILSEPTVEETRNQVAVKRGPLVYCLESMDLPEGVNITDVVIPQDIELTPRFDKNLLSGVTVLEGKAEILKKRDWSNQLYQKLVPQKLETAEIKLIPYYAWSNRGKADMTVWMPLNY